jgi:trigger factor
MQIAVEQRPGSRVALTITVGAEVVTQEATSVFRKYASRVKVPGFRPGKAPQNMISSMVDQEAVMNHAIDNVIDKTYREALSEHKFIPLERAQVEDMTQEEDGSLKFVVVLTVRPTINLGEYKGVEITKQKTDVTDEMVQAEIDRVLQSSAKYDYVTDEIKADDYAIINYVAKIDGIDAPDLSSTGYPVWVGHDSIFPELNDGIIGKKSEEEFVVTKEYAADFADESLAGKTVEYTVIIENVRRLVIPELTDEFVATISDNNLSNKDELVERVKLNLKYMAENNDNDNLRTEVVRKVVELSELDLPEIEVDEEFQHLMIGLEERLQKRHTTLEQFSEQTGRTLEDIQNEQKLIAQDMVRRSLVLADIAGKEGIDVTDEDIDGVFAMEIYRNKGEMSGKSLAKEIANLRREMKKTGALYNIEGKLRYEKVVSFLMQNAVILNPDGTPYVEEVEEEVAGPVNPNPITEKIMAATEEIVDAIEEKKEEAAE